MAGELQAVASVGRVADENVSFFRNSMVLKGQFYQ